ncbi:hypothetical protein D3C87_1908630 [compost metagenome]
MIVSKDRQIQPVEVKPIVCHINDLVHKTSTDALALIVIMHADTNCSCVYSPSVRATNIAASNNFSVENGQYDGVSIFEV